MSSSKLTILETKQKRYNQYINSIGSGCMARKGKGETCNTTALAHATLMEAIPPDAYCGMYTNKSHASRCRNDNPPPSLPNMKAVEVVKG